MLKKYKDYIIQIVIALAVGGISGFLVRGNFDVFDTLKKPPLAPPMMLFPIVWSILFILMGISAARIKKESSTIPFVYLLQLAVNFLWSIIFFNMQAFGFAFIWLILLWILIIIMIAEFYQIDKLAAYLQIPYLLWVTFAGYLTFMIWMLN